VPSLGRSANYKCYSTLSLTKQGRHKDSHQQAGMKHRHWYCNVPTATFCMQEIYESYF
jgi:hypothetical protein